MYRVFESFEDNAAQEKQPASACLAAQSCNLDPKWLEIPVWKYSCQDWRIELRHFLVSWTRMRVHKGPCTYDVRKILEIFNTLPPHPQFTQPISTVCTQNWAILNPPSPLRADVICTWSLTEKEGEGEIISHPFIFLPILPIAGIYVCTYDVCTEGGGGVSQFLTKGKEVAWIWYWQG